MAEIGLYNLKSGSDNGYKSAIDQILTGLPGTVAYLDDVLVAARSKEEGLARLAQVLQRLDEFGVRTDHQPLTAIFGSKKGVPSMAAARLQRWALILSAYDLEVRYRKGVDVPHADALSRLPLAEAEPIELEANFVSHVDVCTEVMNNFCVVKDIAPITALHIGKMTDKDPILSKVRDFVMYGWTSSVEPELAIFLRKKDELSVEQGCLLWGSRVVIPKKLYSSVLQMLHDQHPGVTRMKMLARSYVWWPGMEKSIEDVVASCSACQLTRNSVPKVPLQQWPTTSTRWQRIHIDFAEDPESRQQLLVLIDTYSKWLEVFIMSSMNSSKVIEKLRTLFSSYGLPVELVSDNGRSFTSQEFKTFLHNNNVKFTLTPPYHAASNGSAERSVQEVKKNLLRQVIEEHQRSQRTTLQMKLDNFLFAYRNTPNTVTGLTPAEMFLSWKPRTQLVMLKPNLQSSIDQKHREQKDAADRLRGRSRFFSEGQAVYVKTVRNEKISWVPGKIILKRSPVTYLVSVIGGKPRFCHADHLRARYAEEEEIFVSPKDPAVSPQVPKNSPPPEDRPSSPLMMSPVPRPTTSPRESLGQAQPQPTPASPLAQCSPPPSLRKSARTVRKPHRLDL
ncbi:uncharacterized protein K02A2.6-like [Macrosteles quadrilineatus]|uniref:uncharacterized protein K02A2.6-like n=1 Tax=Macrosteles quadrilineatus TaxID=74068 RepID=UPI0023E19369|nr:uncharacterized protein K02A2.6-like [Macrosteles quadrilineatus]